MRKFKKGEIVTCYMYITVTGRYVKKDGDAHLIDIDDPQVGSGHFKFENWDEAKQRFTTEDIAA